MEKASTNSAYQESNPNFLEEVNNIEKHLWTLIHSKGISHGVVSELYAKACHTYEQIFKSNLEGEKLQEVEFCLWKLHYKHIDEFRKVLRTEDPSEQGTTHMETFKLFLLKSTDFYKKLITKFRPTHEFLCHRFYISVGDLERYKEQYLKTDKHPTWSTSATYYFQAARCWPYSGNPHNQLAVLATYVGDELLALYHCVRSLAVKEPFPSAWNNLLLLLEKNRSSPLQSLSTHVQFNFLNPSERMGSNFSKAEGDSVAGVDLWSLIVRTSSFFFLRSSLEEFDYTFASTMRELDKAFEADDSNLEAMLESYQVMEVARKGPYRILQLVTVFIFILHNRVKEEVKLTNLAITFVFNVMARVVERCLKTSPLDSCPLLPGLLVFLDYLTFLLHKEEEEDEKSDIAIGYFIGKLADFLNRLKMKGENWDPKMSVALWEDHELRSLTPVHVLLDFSSRMDLSESFDRGTEIRIQRIVNSAIELISRRHNKASNNWLFFDKQRNHFYINSGKLESPLLPEEEEEIILLKPLVRCQSAPIKQHSCDDTSSGNQTTSSDETLRRTSSLVTESLSFSFTQGLKETDEQLEEDTVSRRPPSLSAWVVDKNKDKFGLTKPKGLSPIDETSPVTSFDSSIIDEDHGSSYSPPTPSAPLLPEDASWFQNGDIANKTKSFYDQTRYMKLYTNTPFVGISSSEWLRRYRESRNLGSPSAYSYKAQGTNNLKNFLDHGSSKFSLLARYGTPNEQPVIFSENHQLSNGQQSKTNAYSFSDDPGPFLRYLREKDKQRFGGPSSPTQINK